MEREKVNTKCLKRNGEKSLSQTVVTKRQIPLVGCVLSLNHVGHGEGAGRAPKTPLPVVTGDSSARMVLLFLVDWLGRRTGR